MDAQQLSAFVAVAETRSFSAAADRIHVTQPAVSKRVALLEQQLGCRLFDRVARQVDLTEAGRTLLPRARDILRATADARQAIRDLRGTVAGPLRIALSHHVGMHRLPGPLRDYAARYPDVALDVRFMESEAAYDAVLQGAFDIAVVTLAPNAHDRIEARLLWRDALVLVAACDHPLAAKGRLEMADLGDHPAILPGAATYTGRLVRRYFEQHGLTLDISMMTNYLDSIRMMVSIGLGWSLLPTTLLDGSVTTLDCPGLQLSRSLGYIRHRERQLSNAAGCLVALLESSADATDSAKG